MNTFTVPLLVVLLVTSQYLDAYPSASAIGTKLNGPLNLRLKREYGLLQHHGLTNNINNDIPSNLDDNLVYVYSIIPQANHKRLIDF